MRVGALSSGFGAFFRSAARSAPLPTVSPVAAHARHDHGTARAIFRHIMGVAHTHGVRPRSIVRNDALLLIVRRDAKSGGWPIDPAWRTQIFWRSLREAHSARCRLRGGALGRRGHRHQSHQDCRHADPLHHAHPDWFLHPFSSIRLAAPLAPSQNRSAVLQISR